MVCGSGRSGRSRLACPCPWSMCYKGGVREETQDSSLPKAPCYSSVNAPLPPHTALPKSLTAPPQPLTASPLQGLLVTDLRLLPVIRTTNLTLEACWYPPRRGEADASWNHPPPAGIIRPTRQDPVGSHPPEGIVRPTRPPLPDLISSRRGMPRIILLPSAADSSL